MFAAEEKQDLLIGEATHGHFQIELACTACHTDPFGGEEVLQDACMNCHEEELKEAHDSHPKKKFTDPRNADRIAIIDARYCVTCHTEHQREQTHPMGVTIPEDYCFHCHQDIGEDRPSHAGLGFETCASAGCHNYHDNRALYERFLVENSGGPWVQQMAKIALANSAHVTATEVLANTPAMQRNADQAVELAQQHLDNNFHVDAGLACSACHGAVSEQSSEWIKSPGIEQCSVCHKSEAEGFQQGKHGMKLAQQLPAVSPGDSDMQFKATSRHRQQGCNACHSGHEMNTAVAATQSCLGCHNDQHSTAFTFSPHGQLFVAYQQGEISQEEVVSCATCHMPRIERVANGQALLRVEHNQNVSLRPSEKMIRPVCMQCHSLEFSIDALADEKLIKSNFNGKPSKHVPSVDWALKREQSD